MTFVCGLGDTLFVFGLGMLFGACIGFLIFAITAIDRRIAADICRMETDLDRLADIKARLWKAR